MEDSAFTTIPGVRMSSAHRKDVYCGEDEWLFLHPVAMLC